MTAIRDAPTEPSTPADAESAIGALEQARCDAIGAADSEALGRVLHPGYTHVTGRGGTMNRQQYIDWIGERRRRHERGELQIQRFGDTAVIHGPLTNHLSTDDGGTRLVETFVTQVAHRSNGGWRFVAFHITPIR